VCAVVHKKAAKASYGNEPTSYCPICQKRGYFVPFGSPSRAKAKCPRCGSLERHRLLWLFLQKHTGIFQKNGKKMLHIAAESCLENHFRKLCGKGYITADLHDPEAMVKMDITDIRYPNETFDIIMCNHVLEHIPDDIKAISEFYRVLKNGGWAVLLVPMANMEKTYEDESITSEAGRLEAFGQGDHVRLYGRDYADRLKSVGFNVEITGLSELAVNNEVKRMRLLPNVEEAESALYGEGEIYCCKK
jgi:SAM-dependent methyltransferase